MSRIKRIVLTLIATLGLIAPIAVPVSAADANVKGGLACGADWPSPVAQTVHQTSWRQEVKWIRLLRTSSISYR